MYPVPFASIDKKHTTHPYSEFAKDWLPISPNGVPIGVSYDDGRPVLLDALSRDGVKQCFLSVGNLNYGRNMLYSVARFVGEERAPLATILIARNQSAWEEFAWMSSFMFAFPSYKKEAEDILLRTSAYNSAAKRNGSSEKVLLLIDDFDGVATMNYDARNAVLDIVKEPSLNVTVFMTVPPQSKGNVPLLNKWIPIQEVDNGLSFSEGAGECHFYPLNVFG